MVTALALGVAAGRWDMLHPAAPPAAHQAVRTAEMSAREANRVTSGDLLDRALAQVQQQQSIQARVRHRVSLFGQQMRGEGRYLQQGAGEQLRLHLELKIQVGQHVTSFLQVCDGRHLWTRQDLGNQKVSLSRIDLLKVRQAAGQQWQPQWQPMLSGGLPRLLASLRSNYSFADPQPGRLSGQQVWKLRGVRKPGQGGGQEPRARYVELVLGRQRLMFPYRIAFLARSQDEVRLTPLVTMELFEVRLDAPLDPSVFEYPLNDAQQQLHDATGEVIAKLVVGDDEAK